MSLSRSVARAEGPLRNTKEEPLIGAAGDCILNGETKKWQQASEKECQEEHVWRSLVAEKPQDFGSQTHIPTYQHTHHAASPFESTAV